MCKNTFCHTLKKHLSILFMMVYLCNAKWWQCRKKWTLFPIFKLHEQSELMQFLKLWLNLFSLKSFNPNRRPVRNLNPVGWWIPYVSSHMGLIKIKRNIKIFLKAKCNSDMSVWYCLNCSILLQYMEKTNF